MCDKIALQVCSRHFITTRSTLVVESGFFSALLSGRWQDSSPDGSIFIDADPDLFSHVLRYLRRGVLPVFFDSAKGHDYALYLALLEEAKYFQITRLEDWLRNKTYLQALRLSRVAEEVQDLTLIAEESLAHLDIEYHPRWVKEKVYVCPRDIAVHRGKPMKCGRQCEKEKEGGEDKFEYEDALRMLVFRKELVFAGDICVDGRE